jgi:hypothetical protein
MATTKQPVPTVQRPVRSTYTRREREELLAVIRRARRPHSYRSAARRTPM